VEVEADAGHRRGGVGPRHRRDLRGRGRPATPGGAASSLPREPC
jgi:hypothetical protein